MIFVELVVLGVAAATANVELGEEVERVQLVAVPTVCRGADGLNVQAVIVVVLLPGLDEGCGIDGSSLPQQRSHSRTNQPRCQTEGSRCTLLWRTMEWTQ